MRILIVGLLFLAAALPALAAPLPNIGFAPGTLWYSQEPFFAGDSVHIYTVLYNGGNDPIVGTVVFYANNSAIGQEAFEVAPATVEDISIEWTAQAGEQTVSARIENLRRELPGGETVAITLANEETGQNSRTIETDIDNDDLGSIADADDDGDGIEDETELTQGSDPKDSTSTTTEKETGVVDLVTTVLTTVLTDTVLPPLIGAGKSVYETVETFRESQKEKTQERLTAAKEQAHEEDQDSLTAAAAHSNAGKWIRSISIFANSLLLYVLSYHILFYLTFALLFFFLLRSLYKRNFGDRFE